MNATDITSLVSIESYGADRQSVDLADGELDRLEAALFLARGRTSHARYVNGDAPHPDELAFFSRAADLFRALGDVRGLAEATFWIGTFHQTIRRDDQTALPYLEEAHALAVEAGDDLVLSCVERHLGFVDYRSGLFEAAEVRLQASVELRRRIGFHAGVAAGLLALAELALELGDSVRSGELLDEATDLATAANATDLVDRIAQTRG